MREKLVALAALAAALTPMPAQGQASRAYFTARVAQSGAPRQLDQATRDYYVRVFAAIDKQDWAGAQPLLAQRDGLLHPVALAELYLAANSPKVELTQIQAWMERGRNLPEAAQLSRLALTRGATTPPDVPADRIDRLLGGLSRRTRPASIADGTMRSWIDLATSAGIVPSAIEAGRARRLSPPIA